MLFPRQIARSPRQVGLPPLTVLLPRQTSSAGSLEAVAHPLLAIILPRQVAVQAGHSPGATGTRPRSGLPRQTVLFLRQIVRSPRQVGPPPLNSATLQATSSASSQEAVALPPLSNNITEAGSSSDRSLPRGNRYSTRLRARGQ